MVFAALLSDPSSLMSSRWNDCLCPSISLSLCLSLFLSLFLIPDDSPRRYGPLDRAFFFFGGDERAALTA